MSDAAPPTLPAPGAPPDRVALDEILTRARVLALQRFPSTGEALEALFEMAAQLSRQAWPDPSASPPPAEQIAEEAPEVEVEAEPEPPAPDAAQAELLTHLERLEELLEALEKT